MKPAVYLGNIIVAGESCIHIGINNSNQILELPKDPSKRLNLSKYGTDIGCVLFPDGKWYLRYGVRMLPSGQVLYEAKSQEEREILKDFGVSSNDLREAEKLFKTKTLVDMLKYKPASKKH